MTFCQHQVRFQFLGARPHRAPFLVRKSLALDRLRGLLRRLLVDVVFGGHAMVSLLSCRSGEACFPSVKQTVKRLPSISITCLRIQGWKSRKRKGFMKLFSAFRRSMFLMNSLVVPY